MVLKESNPELDHTGRLKLAGERWKVSESADESRS